MIITVEAPKGGLGIKKDSRHRKSNSVLFVSGVTLEALALCFLTLRQVASFALTSSGLLYRTPLSGPPSAIGGTNGQRISPSQSRRKPRFHGWASAP
ncbi:hypothetical protein LZ32DRAFT_226869 [Colletotrichum eremochloae]|nr:hypothetical protein LZ32DRAFT_226869 [Colletotrichum eremochloae]